MNEHTKGSILSGNSSELNKGIKISMQKPSPASPSFPYPIPSTQGTKAFLPFGNSNER